MLNEFHVRFAAKKFLCAPYKHLISATLLLVAIGFFLIVGKGVVLAALTTLVGFGSLVLSGYPGLQSMGAVALMGVGCSALIAMTLVPVLLQKLLPKGPSS